MKRAVENRARGIGIDLDGAQVERLIDYAAMLVTANSRFNVLSRRAKGAGDLLERHLMDSLRAVRHLLGKKIADVGSGAGLPGVPLAIVRSDCQVTLIERASRRCDFLRLVKTRLALANIEVLEGDARELACAASFDTALARALARPEQALRMLLRLVNASGRAVLFAGEGRLDLPERLQGRSICLLKPKGEEVFS